LWWPIQTFVTKQRINLYWLLLSTVHSTMLALKTCHLYYILIRRRVSFALSPSISSPNLVINIALASHGSQHAGPSLWNSLPHHLRSTDSYTVIKSNLKTQNFLWCKHLWPLAISIHALQIRHNHVDFCVLKLYYVMYVAYLD